MRKILVLLLMTALVCSAAQATIITNVVRLGSSGNTPPEISATPLAEDALSFVDRTHEYNNLPVEALGAEYIKVANNDKTVADYGLEVTISQPALLALFIDNRVGGTAGDGDWAGVDPDPAAAGMNWVADMGFNDTGLDIGIDEGGDGSIDKYSSIYVLEVGPGVYTLGAQNDGGGRNMYGVAAVVPEPITIMLMGFGAFGVLRRRK